MFVSLGPRQTWLSLAEGLSVAEVKVPMGQGTNWGLDSRAMVGGQAIQGGTKVGRLGSLLPLRALPQAQTCCHCWGGRLAAWAAASGLGLQQTGSGQTAQAMVSTSSESLSQLFDQWAVGGSQVPPFPLLVPLGCPLCFPSQERGVHLHLVEILSN